MQRIDFAILDWIQEVFRSDIMDWLMPKITLLGSAGVFWILIALILMMKKETKKSGKVMLVALAAGFLIGNVVMKPLFMRERPPWIRPEVQLLVRCPSNFSFPSGHALTSAVCANVLLIRERKLGIICWVLALLIGFTRLYLYVHFPSDVLAGFMIGAAIGRDVNGIMEKQDGVSSLVMLVLIGLKEEHVLLVRISFLSVRMDQLVHVA